MSYQPHGYLPIGSVVATFPTLTGAYSCVATTLADVNGFVLCGGQTIVDVTSPMNGQAVPNINNSAFLMGNATSGTTGGVATLNLAHTHSMQSHTHNMAHYHQWGYSYNTGQNGLSSVISPSTNTTSFAAGAGTQAVYTTGGPFGSGGLSATVNGLGNTFYTSGSLAQSSGTGSTAQTGGPSSASTDSQLSGSQSILPPYITATFIMRIK